MMLQTAAEPLLSWPGPILELVGFLPYFATIGAVGFRYGAARQMIARRDAAIGAALRAAARIGLIGALIGVVVLCAGVVADAADKHLAIAELIARGRGMLIGRAVLLLVMVAAFSLAGRGRAGAWPVALVAAFALVLRNVVTLKWTTLVNPLHVVGGSLWIGTLFVLFAAGIPAIMRSEPAGPARGRAVADLVNGFSPLALASGGLLVLMGVITGVRHVKHLDALWTTPYGLTLILKLTLVALVFALGAWNWRRMRPTLGPEGAAVAIQRSARAELFAAALVLIVTSVLISLPTPK